ncbi:MAG: SH3 domain-containing protein, partial [Candidatus Omnitrophica bacterium]|nr:SH3 domain-containing protein [Candidatus Omnitrophota bacterium]
MQLYFKSKILLVLLAVFLVFRPQGRGLASDSESQPFTGKVNANNINVRVDATTGAPVACTLSKGRLVEVVREAYDWYKIRLPKTAPSYIKKNLVECINRTVSPSDPAKCLNAKVTAARVNIRLGPSEDSWILGKADKLSVVNILGEKGSWYMIEPVHESFGWIYKKFVDKAQAPEPKLAEAKSPDQLAIEGTVSP